jgi:hypothetical protein
MKIARFVYLILAGLAVVFLSFCSGVKSNKQENISMSGGTLLHKTVTNWHFKQHCNISNRRCDGNFAVQVCAYPTLVGPEFNTVFKVIDVVSPNNDSLRTLLIGNNLWVKYNDEIIREKSDELKFRAGNEELCNGTKESMVFIGLLSFVKNELIDRTTGATYSGYFLFADSLIEAK